MTPETLFVLLSAVSLTSGTLFVLGVLTDAALPTGALRDRYQRRLYATIALSALIAGLCGDAALCVAIGLVGHMHTINAIIWAGMGY